MSIILDIDHNTKLPYFFTFLTNKCTFSCFFCNTLLEKNFYDIARFLVLNDSKRCWFCISINARANVHIFRALKSFIFNIDLFWDTLYSSFSKNLTFLISLSFVLNSLWVTDIGMMCHYITRTLTPTIRYIETCIFVVKSVMLHTHTDTPTPTII